MQWPLAPAGDSFAFCLAFLKSMQWGRFLRASGATATLQPCKLCLPSCLNELQRSVYWHVEGGPCAVRLPIVVIIR